MKKLLALMMVLTISLSLMACGDKEPPAPTAVEFSSKTFGDITINVPTEFGEVEENENFYLSAGPGASIVVTKLTEIDLPPSEWDEDTAVDMLEPMYGSLYSDMELSAFEGNINMNGNTAVYFAFYGTNANGEERLMQMVRLYNADETGMYLITLMQIPEHEFITAEVAEQILNSITLEK